MRYLITGAGSGIGAALARLLVRTDNEARLVIHTRGASDALEAVAQELRQHGAEIHTRLGDLAHEDNCLKLIAAARTNLGGLDALIANAGFPIIKALENSEPAELDYAFRGNVYSLYTMAREARSMLAQSRRGRLVAVGSFTAHLFRPDLPTFSLSAGAKGAVATACRALAIEFAADNITVNCVVPGLIKKDEGTRDGLAADELKRLEKIIPLGRLGTPEEVAAIIGFLLTEPAGYITGQALHVNGGLG